MKVRITVAIVTLALTGAVAAHAQVQPQERINTALDTCSLQEISSEVPEMPIAGVSAPIAFTRKL